MLNKIAMMAVLFFSFQIEASESPKKQVIQSYQSLAQFKAQKDHYLLELDLGNFQLSDIKVSVINGYLRVTAMKQTEQKLEDSSQSVIERFYYATRLPQGYVEASALKATFQDGILRIIVPILDKNMESSQVLVEG